MCSLVQTREWQTVQAGPAPGRATALGLNAMVAVFNVEHPHTSHGGRCFEGHHDAGV